MSENYAAVLESYIINEPAQEGIGLDLLSIAGKGIGKVAKSLGIFIGLNVLLISAIMIPNEISRKRQIKRYNNPTSEEKLSRDNYNNTWVEEIDNFRKMIIEDIDKADKKLDIKKFLYTSDSTETSDTITKYANYYRYNHYICSLAWENCQYPDADGDDEGNPELVKEFSEKISQMKPYFEKWKSAARKFAPYFELVIEVDEPRDNYYFCNFDLKLVCKWVDKDGIMKPGLPEFNK